MLPRADLNPTRPPASLEAATTTVSSTDARLEVFKRLNQIAIGRELSATVDALLDDNTFLVKLADTTARMALPVGTKVGDTFSMVFIAREPKPTFLLTQQQGSAPATISTTARLIDHLLQAAAQEGDTPTVIARAPLLPSTAPADPKQISTALQNAITSSGLFYESHLHDWISGSRPRAELLQEPQAQLPRSSPSTAPHTPSESAHADLARLAHNMRELGEGTQKLIGLVREAQVQVQAAGTGLHLTDAELITGPQAALPTLEPEAARLIGLQLNTLENEAIRWQGQLWPGQTMEWEISEDKPEGGSHDAQQEPAWTSTVRFELPHLGDVSATVRLVGDRVHIQVQTASDDTASTVRQYGGLLADALEAAGAPLDSLTVKQHESP
ncbi:MAG TPA: flagellar hook-length control protein FliK [Noviherbaspirillum sp.]